MASRSVQLHVAGVSCRVVTSADDAELAALSAMVEERLAGVLKSGQPVTKEAILLVAVALAHEVTAERARSRAIADRARATLSRLLERVDGVLAPADDAGRERPRLQVTIEPPAAPKRPKADSKARRPAPDVTVDRLREVKAEKPRLRPLPKEHNRD